MAKHAKTAQPVYGNVTLSQITHFIITVVGKDALVAQEYIDDTTLNDAYKEKGSWEKFKVSKQDASFQFTYKDSLFGKIYQFFLWLEETFGITDYHRRLYMDFIVEQCIVQITGTRPFESKQSAHMKKILFDQQLELINKYTGDIKRLPYNPEFNAYVEKGILLTFTDIIEDFCVQIGLTFEDFYAEVATYSNLPQEEAANSLKRSLQRYRKENTVPAWSVFFPLLQYVSEKEKSSPKKPFTGTLVHFYFYQHFRDALPYLSIKKEDWNEFEQLVLHFDEYAQRQFFEKHINVYNTGMHDLKQWYAYFDGLLPPVEHGSLQIKPTTLEQVQAFQQDYPRLRLELPHAIVFWEHWFCAKEYVFRYLQNGDITALKQALNAYTVALEQGMYFAGKHLRAFLHEALAVGFYYDWKSDPKAARDRVAKASNKEKLFSNIPISVNTQPFFKLAYAFDFVLNGLNDAYHYYYDWAINFWSRFVPPTSFAQKLCEQDNYLSQTRFYPDIPQNKTEEEYIEETLASVSDGMINNRLPTKHTVAYTPLCFALEIGRMDYAQRFLDKKQFPSLNVNIPNTNNSYPLSEVLTQCKYNTISRILRRRPSEKNETLVDLCLRILERTDKATLFTQTNHRKVSILQEALETADMRIVKPIVDKMTDNGKTPFPDDFRITADVLTPLYWAVHLKFYVMYSHAEIEQREKHATSNIRWENLAVPGFSEEEKRAFFARKKASEESAQEIYEEFDFLLDKTGKRQELLQSFDCIIDLLIERTRDVDDFIAYPKEEHFQTILRTDYGTWREPTNPEHRQGCNALQFAVEIDDVVTCKKLISAGANVRRRLGLCSAVHDRKNNPVPIPNDCLYRSIAFCSWNVLHLLLTEYTEQVRDEMTRTDINMTPLVYFLLRLKALPMPDKTSVPSLLSRFLPLFQRAGSDFAEQTAVGSAQELLVII